MGNLPWVAAVRLGLHIPEDLRMLFRFAEDMVEHPRNPFGEVSLIREAGGLVRSRVMAGEGLPHGNGEPVVTIPGLGAGSVTLRPLNIFLTHLGYKASSVGWSNNTAPTSKMMYEITRHVYDQCVAENSRAVLIGHSRGGNEALELARTYTDLVRHVFTLGSPVHGEHFPLTPALLVPLTAIYVKNIIEYGTGWQQTELGYLRRLQDPLTVPTTCFWSKDDGVVYPDACKRDDATNIEVRTSHIGMVSSREVFEKLAVELASALRTETAVKPNLHLVRTQLQEAYPRMRLKQAA